MFQFSLDKYLQVQYLVQSASSEIYSFCIIGMKDLVDWVAPTYFKIANFT